MFQFLPTATHDGIILLPPHFLVELLEMNAFRLMNFIFGWATRIPGVDFVCAFVVLLVDFLPFAVFEVVVGAAAGCFRVVFFDDVYGFVVRITDCFIVDEVLIECLVEKLAVFVHDFV
jgi:hypothetical protein